MTTSLHNVIWITTSAHNVIKISPHLKINMPNDITLYVHVVINYHNISKYCEILSQHLHIKYTDIRT